MSNLFGRFVFCRLIFLVYLFIFLKLELANGAAQLPAVQVCAKEFVLAAKLDTESPIQKEPELQAGGEERRRHFETVSFDRKRIIFSKGVLFCLIPAS